PPPREPLRRPAAAGGAGQGPGGTAEDHAHGRAIRRPGPDQSRPPPGGIPADSPRPGPDDRHGHARPDRVAAPGRPHRGDERGPAGPARDPPGVADGAGGRLRRPPDRDPETPGRAAGRPARRSRGSVMSENVLRQLALLPLNLSNHLKITVIP